MSGPTDATTLLDHLNAALELLNQVNDIDQVVAQFANVQALDEVVNQLGKKFTAISESIEIRQKQIVANGEGPKIKLVDINKLIEPKLDAGKVGRKSVTFDSSVIVLTSSDEESPKKVPKLKIPLKSVLKSAQKMSSSSEEETNHHQRKLRRRDKDKTKFSKLDVQRSERMIRTERRKLRELVVSDSDDDDVPKTKPTRKRGRQNNSSDSDVSVEQVPKFKPLKVVLQRIHIDNGKEVASTSKRALKMRFATTSKRALKKGVATDSSDDESAQSTINSKFETNADKPKPVNMDKKTLKFDSSSSDDEKPPTPVENKEKSDSSDDEPAKASTSVEDNEKSDSSDEEPVKASTPVEDNENSESSRDEPAKASTPVRENEKSDSSDDEPVKASTSVEDNENSESSDDEPAKVSTPEKKNEKSDSSDDEPVKASTPVEDLKNSESSDDEPAMAPTLAKNSKSDSSINDEEGEKSGEDKKSSDEEPAKAQVEDNKKLDSSSSDDESFGTFSKKLDKDDKKRRKKVLVSDSEDSQKNEEAEEASEEEPPAPKEEDTKKSSRKRIRKQDSSSDDEDKTTRKQIRKMIDRDSLSEKTKEAEKEEKERKIRIIEKQRKYNQIFDLKADATVDKVVLDFDDTTNSPLLSANEALVKQLKPHQVQGIKFMWDATFESMKRLKEAKGSGCILAHCMGLGKTLSVITLIHTLLTNEETGVKKVMVVCPVNTVLNWKSEFRKWLPDEDEFEVYELVSMKSSSKNRERNYIVQCWHKDGGVLIIGYNMFRTLSNPDNKSISKKLRASFHTALVDPGPDLVVCDEGHLLKNEKTNLSIAMNRIKTMRRIVLTGTPLQNNLREYWCMVQFIKPNLLGTYKEYLNRFVNPITNGQYTDSTQHDIMIMRRRSHVLHKLLDGVVQRQDYNVLAPYLPPKHEYVLFVQLTEIQVKLYKHYMQHFARRSGDTTKTAFLFTDFQELHRICIHPIVLLNKSTEVKEKRLLENSDDESEGSLKDFIDDEEDDESSSSSSGSDTKASSSGRSKRKKSRVTRAQAAQNRENVVVSSSDDEVIMERKLWWEDYVAKDELDNVNLSAKLFLLLQILKECEEIGDKVLVFSQSLYTLNCIEYFLSKIDDATQSSQTEKIGGHSGNWCLGLDYFRLDGSSSCDNRAIWCNSFNSPNNPRARLFLISTKAGGLGINLVAANRVIIFDVSWNPSHDIQSIYRVYRFGQTKPSYIYRFVAYGTMEMKIYERQVTKQAISKRVIDEQQIDRHYSQTDIMELYKTDLEPTDRPIPLVPKDVLLAELLQKYDKTLYKYHEHQSLLENKQDEELNEEERKAAWDEFENEKVLRKNTLSFNSSNNSSLFNFGGQINYSPQLIQMALRNIMNRDNPGWSEVQIKGILPALVAQLQMQMSENDYTLYTRVQQEIQMMQAIQAERMRQNYLQYQMLKKQHRTNQMLGSLNVSQDELRLMAATAQQQLAGSAIPEIIELND